MKYKPHSKASLRKGINMHWWSKRICWYRMFYTIGCVGYFIGCLYQTCLFLQLYYEYPTSMEVNVEQAPVILFPAVTICNGNRVRQDVWCKRNPSICAPAPLESQEAYITRLQDTYKYLNRSNRIEMGHALKDFIKSCQFDEDRSCDGLIGQYFNYEYTNCFTINAHWVNASAESFNSSMFRPRSGRSSELSTMLNLQRQLYSPMNPVVRARMTIHDPDTVPNPQYDGVSLQPGQTYMYGIRENKVNVLPAPYQTNCKNYTALEEVRTGSRLTQEGCMSECCATQHLKYCNCTVHRLSLLYNIRTCWEVEEMKCLKNIDQTIKNQCYPQCRMPCSKITYAYVSVDSFTLQQGACVSEDMFNQTLTLNDRENLICLRVFYNTADSEVFNHVPKYNGIQVFSIIGGYIGLWLGISLLNVHTYFMKHIFPFFLKKKILPKSKKTDN